MADTTALKNRIRAAIKANDNQEITGPVLQQTLLDIVDELDLNPELENEAQQRQNGDSALQQNITAERTRAEGVEQANASKLSYFVCDTAAATAAKTISATGYVLSLGGSIKVEMTNANTVADATLNINSTGAKPLFYDGERASATNSWEAGEIVEVYYDGTNFYANNVAGSGKFASGEKVKEVGIDDKPTAGSDNLVKSGGVFSTTPTIGQAGAESDLDISDEQGNVLVRFENGHIKTKNFDSSKEPQKDIGAYDISAAHEGAVYADLANALGTNGANIPEGIRKGGMSVKFVLSSDNKYVQYRLTANSWSINTNDWESYNDIITSNQQFSDLDISDEQGNVLVRFENGHIKTKNFDSSKEPQKDILLPTYWQSYFDSKIVTIQNKIKSLGTTGVAFGFVTDSHWNQNYKQTPYLLQYIKQNTLIEDFISGGDVIVGVTTKDDAELQLKTFAEAYKNINIVNIVGNHDLNTNLQTTWAQALSEGDFYYYMQRASEKDIVWENGKLYGYSDNNSQKIRYIFLNSGYQTQTSGTDIWTIPNEEIEYLKARIVELPQGWGVIVFTHSYFTYAWSADPQGSGETGWTQHRSGLQVKNALDEIYDTVDATIIAVISGHTHRDMSEYSGKGYPCIAVSCDTYNYTSMAQSYNIPKVQGTTTEQLFDLFFIDTQNRTIYDMRIGAGDTNSDRTFTY